MDFPDHSFAGYWYALGKFVHRYAEIEATMHQILRIVSGTSVLTSKVLFSGVRVRGAADTIKRFYSASGQLVPNDLERAFERIGEITKIRDRLLHNGINFEDGKAIVTDENKNFSARAFKHTISIKALDDLESDAITLNACLVKFWIECERPDLIESAQYQNTIEAAQRPWLYKPPKPMKQRAVPRDPARENKSPPQSSQA
ncbi:hypothetical protein [Erythrobacter sp. F6033]|uniref:hypothetical protein n=1 Tax=Erythrobacter sp. F6033 TaxID=2926401 RepID=UPI001FF6744F|nr:hypothetical protein [Erythrobacter sp. F6033]MCK0129044.1 hypothetical protein [Erythrobacter sp. F6033]